MTPKRILLINDSREILDVTKMALEMQAADWDVLTAVSGQEGIAQTISEQPDAILLDVMMLNMDGYTVLKKLKANARTQGIPVIFARPKLRLRLLGEFEVLTFKVGLANLLLFSLWHIRSVRF